MGLCDLNVVVMRVEGLDLNAFVGVPKVSVLWTHLGLFMCSPVLLFASKGMQPGPAGSLLHSSTLLLLLASDRDSCKLASYRTGMSDGA